MSMFDNLVLDEFTMLDEGKQADEYRARKAKEASRAQAADDKQFKDRMYRKAMASSYDAKGDKKKEEDYEDNVQRGGARMMASSRTARKAYNTMDKYDNIEPTNKKEKREAIEAGKHMGRGLDALSRHDRRKAKKSAKTESALMLIAGYESEFTY